jgi:hypothetical protein
VGVFSPPPEGTPPQLREWLAYLDRMSPEITSLVRSRNIYQTLREIVGSNPKVATPITLHNWISVNYAHTSAIAVRRMIDDDTDTVSMVRLLLDVRYHAESITREWHRTLYPGDKREADRRFAKHAGRRAKRLEKRVVQGQIDELMSCREELLPFINRRLAHYIPKEVAAPKLRQLHTAVDALERIWLYYDTLLRAGGLVTLLPYLQPGWKRPLTLPWISED